MPYKTGIRLLGVARNPANGFPARLLGGHCLSFGAVGNTHHNYHCGASGKALCGASDKCLTPSGGGPWAAPPHYFCCRADDNGWCGAGTFSGGPGDVDVEVLDVDVDLVRRRGQRLSSPDCPG